MKTDQDSPTTKDVLRRVARRADAIFTDLVAIRRHLHRYPELSFNEFATAGFIADELEKCGLSVTRGVAETGVVADLIGSSPGPTVLLRADIDALPIREQTGLPYASENDGVMHACGHDIHTASLLGAARILSELKDQLHGTVRFVFQPAEETAPGGAVSMIESGLLDREPKPEVVFGLHTWPPLQAGKVAVRSGDFMASNDEIKIVVTGQGGHAAEPHRLSADPVLVAAQIIVSLQSVISRNCPPDVPSVLSFGSIVAEGANNIIPNHVTILGTLRCMDEEWRANAKVRIQTIVQNVAAGYGATAVCDILDGYPMLRNDNTIASFVRTEAAQFLGTDHVETAPLWFAAEDFAYYLEQIPGAFLLLGVNKAEVQVTGLHTDTYNPNEESLKTGASVMASLALQYCWVKSAQAAV